MIVEEGWKYEVWGTPMFILCKRLKDLKPKLKEFNNRCFKDLPIKVQMAKESFMQKQVQNLNDPTNVGLMEDVKQLRFEFLSLARYEEAFYKQKSRVQNIQLGDQCTNYFHKVVKGKKARNAINSLVNADGIKLVEKADIVKESVDFFKKLLGTANEAKSSIEELKDILKFEWSEEQKKILSKSVSADEIKKTMFSIISDKAPGPDGYTSHFFKKSWDVVGRDVINAVMSFFQSGKLLQELNSTIITLVPKVPNPEKTSEYRPISCCNTVYKCIPKIIANRLREVLPGFVSENQSAFVYKRSIADNVLLSQELLRNYHRNDGSPRCTMKIDLMKAYDSIQWDFIINVLSAIGTPDQSTLLLVLLRQNTLYLLMGDWRASSQVVRG